MSAATDRARAMRKTLTPPEARLWRALKPLRSEGWRFRRQAPFRGYFVDFVCFGGRLAVEVDGAHHHDSDQILRDAVRDGVLAREGFATLRIPGLDIRDNLEGVVQLIRDRLCVGSPPDPPDHPPQEGRESAPANHRPPHHRPSHN